jgi:hypothetical protein
MSIESQLKAILNGCDKEQLNKYLNDEDASDLLVKSLDQFQALVSEKESLQLANKKLAESNLNKEPVLDKIKQDLTQAISEFEKTKREYTSLKETYDAVGAVGGDMSLQSIYNALQTAAQRSEEDTEKMAEDFFCSMSTGMHTEEELNMFQKKFLEARTQAHLQKIKADKMKELLPNF